MSYAQERPITDIFGCVAEVVAHRITAALSAGKDTVFPDDAMAGAGSVYLTDSLKLEQNLAG